MSNPIDIELTVNGKRFAARVEPRIHLADFLRHGLGLTGTHIGCENGVCGACTVIVDGQPVRSCLMLAVQADAATVETVEGLATETALHPLQAAFAENHALQCGFCTPGMLMTLVSFLKRDPDPSETSLRAAIAGNICRCTGYETIVTAGLRAAATMRQGR